MYWNVEVLEVVTVPYCIHVDECKSVGEVFDWVRVVGYGCEFKPYL